MSALLKHSAAGLLLGLTLTGCAQPNPSQPPAGTSVTRCLAIGGAMKDDNADLYKWMTGRTQTGKAVVIAYATSKPEGADTRMRDRLAKHGWTGDVRLLPDVLKGEDERKTAAEWLPGNDIVFFTGGDQSRIMERFKAAPELRRALDEGMSHRGTPVAGSSAGAAVMCNPMFTGGGSESALAGTAADDGEKDDGDAAQPKGTPKKGVQMGEGLGLVAPILDTHFFPRGRVGRLVAGLEKSGNPFGIGINENRAVFVTSGTMCLAVGDCAGLLVDTRELKRDGLSRKGVRVNLLSSGDTWDYPAKGERYRSVQSPRKLAPGAVSITAPKGPDGAELPDAWGKNVALDMLKRLAANPAGVQVANSPKFQLVITADERTKFGWSPDKPEALTITDARLDIIERKAEAPDPKPAR